MLNWSAAPEYFPYLIQGALITIEVSIFSLLIAFPLGLVWALCRLSKRPLLNFPVAGLVNLIRGMPMIVFLFYIYFVMPDLGIDLTSTQAAVIGLAVAYSTYISEVFRAGIEAVDRGQMEAARSIGMGVTKAMTRVVLPQAIRISVPPFTNMLVMIVKDSAIASTIAVTELTRQGQLLAAASFDNMTVFTFVAATYLVMTLPLMLWAKRMERRFGADKVH